MTLADIRMPEKMDTLKRLTLIYLTEASSGGSGASDGSFIDAEVLWSPMAFRGHFAALTMATDVTERRRVEHRNQIFPN